ncbi:DNA-directed RNA polymerase iii subunit rpc5 [Phtheirospermum japonicum]|uniref:DNA-directed RNA polymerase iii subunit rpc5 n=1 Tax=Phtheirospermum japonicum TaxID=374723 RepID=A0A830BBL0_9LAMI|nr:DNA-directed RNA polymerase iii subunit rpc5 [Phtheirospermum japonicum]
MDLDELSGGPSKAPSRPSRFAPKGSKFKPKPKTEQSGSQPPPASGSVESVTEPKKEELVTEPETKPEYANDAIDMDVEEKPGVKEEEDKDDLMETEATETELEDEIVREVDVYFTPSVDARTRLYVLQYPLRPLWRPYEMEERCEEVRVKPGSAEVEIDLAVDVDSKNYDSCADGVQMKKQTLSVSWKPPHVSGYAVGVLTGNKLHLNPVHAVVQLRPSMQHLESKDPKRKTAGPSGVEEKVKLEKPQEGKPSSSKKPSKDSEQPVDDEEGWVPLKYHSAGSDMTTRYLRKMMSQEDSQIDFSMSSYDYLNSLCPGTSSDSFSSKGPPIRSLLTLPLKERFRTWLLEGPPLHRFDTLKYLAPDESVEEVLRVLQEHARLVQGLWVPKSSLMYGSDSGMEVLARDCALLLFSKSVIIKISQLPRNPKLNQAMKNVLNSLAVERPAFQDWKLKGLPDLGFIKSNPSVVRKQEKEWESSEERINELLSRSKNGPSTKSNTANNPTSSRSASNVAARNTKGAATSRTAMSEEVREAITKALQKLFKTVKICSFQQISQLLRDMAVSESARGTGFAREAVAAANSIDAHPHELQAILNQVAINIHGICVPKSSPDSPQYDPFRRVVIDLLIAQGPNAKLKKASIYEAAKVQLQREPTPAEYQKVLQELCTSQGGAWTLNSAGANPKH